MNNKKLGLACWLLFSLVSCVLLHRYLVPVLATYQFTNESDFKQVVFTDVLEYKTFSDQQFSQLSISDEGLVNPVFPLNLPADLKDLETSEKTQVFISLIAPEALRVNSLIETERKELIRIIAKKEKHHALTSRESWWVNLLCEKYNVGRNNLSELLVKVDIIPPSLVLAQAITESAWGTSRFALEGNGLYGQHVPTSSNAKHIVSLSGNVKVAAYDSVLEATLSYANNLNSHRAYNKLRELRANKRAVGQEPHGAEMAEGLLHYSEIGVRYISDLKYLIKKYELEKFDAGRLNKKYRGVSLTFRR